MTTRRRAPHALADYLQLSEAPSLVLLTSTLGCSINWLSAQFVAAGQEQRDSTTDKNTQSRTVIVLASFLRDLAYWRNELRRAIGVDVDKLTKDGQFAFIDGMVQLSPASSQITNEIERAISAAISKLQSSDNQRIILVLDAPDILLATTQATTSAMNLFMLRLRSQAHMTVLSCSADLPLVAAASASSDTHRPTPVEVENAAFLTTQGHNARLIMSVRELETGAAKDVSGVLRITRGGGAYTLDGNNSRIEDAELLYLIQRDGVAKVFTRGSEVN